MIPAAALEQTNELKNITIMSFGTRGDFQPYLALAIQLKSAGYNVRLLGTVTFQKYAEEFGIQFVVISDHCIDVSLRENEALRNAISSGDLIQMAENGADALINLPYVIKTFFQEMKDHTPDLFIEGTICDYFGHYVEHILKLPSIPIKLQAFYHDPDRASMGLPTLPDGGHHQILMNIFEGEYDKWVAKNDIITQSLGYQKLADVFSKQAYMEHSAKRARGETFHIVCQSSLFKNILAPGATKELSFVGPVIMEAKDQPADTIFFGGDDTHQKIEAFINEKPESKPVYCGWGSMVCNSPEHMIRFVVASLKRSGERGIVLGGVANLSLELLKQSTTDEDLISYAEKNILFVKKASHENLFPRVKCIVHHGGAGTTNAALRAGVPSIITPVFFDQWDHAHVLNELGVGFGFASTQFQKITPEELGTAIHDVVNDEDMKAQASRVAEAIRAENGQKAVLKVIEEFYKNCTHQDSSIVTTAPFEEEDSFTREAARRPTLTRAMISAV